MMYKRKNAIAFLLAVIIFASSSAKWSLYAETVETNKYNVVAVLDASGSMNYTDPDLYRYEAVGLFVNLLAMDGNHIGNVIFSNDILKSQDIISVNKQKAKDKFLSELKETEASGYTNIGKGIDTAVDMIIEQGDPSLSSVILFLSDGNTEMPDSQQTEDSLALKAEALQKARENGIQIYSVCLNANDQADISEMSQLSEATGGRFHEVSSPEDLVYVFNDFYNMIYGTSTILVGEEEVPDKGVVEKEYELPSFGVEEVNIIIYGLVDDVTVTNPSGNVIKSQTSKTNVYTFVKFSDIEEGKWKLAAKGNPGTQIKINMVYNTNLMIDLSCDAVDEGVRPDTDVPVEAVLISNGETAVEDSQYSGYEATLEVMDRYRKVIDEIQMHVEGGRFTAAKKYDEGAYYFKVKLTGNYLSKESDEIGPLIVSDSSVEEEIPLNTPPEAIDNPVTKTVYIIPFRENEFTLDLSTLAKDKEENELYYEIVSSSFVEGQDYLVDDTQLKITDFSLRKGAFTVRAYDSMGEYCDIEVIISSINVGILTLVGLGCLGLVALIVVVSVCKKLGGTPFRGTINVRSEAGGKIRNESKKGKRGNIPLSRFDVDQFGLKKGTRFQATGKGYIEFIAKPEVFYHGQKVTRIRIDGGGAEYRFTPEAKDKGNYLFVSFTAEQGKNRNSNSEFYSGGFSGGDYGGETYGDDMYGGDLYENNSYGEGTYGNDYSNDVSYDYGNQSVDNTQGEYGQYED